MMLLWVQEGSCSGRRWRLHNVIDVTVHCADGILDLCEAQATTVEWQRFGGRGTVLALLLSAIVLDVLGHLDIPVSRTRVSARKPMHTHANTLSHAICVFALAHG